MKRRNLRKTVVDNEDDEAQQQQQPILSQEMNDEAVQEQQKQPTLLEQTLLSGNTQTDPSEIIIARQRLLGDNQSATHFHKLLTSWRPYQYILAPSREAAEARMTRVRKKRHILVHIPDTTTPYGAAIPPVISKFEVRNHC